MRRSRRIAGVAGRARARRRAVSSSTMRAAELAADLLAAVGDLERAARMASLGPLGPASATAGPNSAREHAPASRPDRSTRRSSRPGRGPAGRAWRRPAASAARATSGSAWMPGVDDRPAVPRRVLEPHGRLARGRAGRPAGTSTASRWRDAGRRSGRLRRWRRRWRRGDRESMRRPRPRRRDAPRAGRARRRSGR